MFGNLTEKALMIINSGEESTVITLGRFSHRESLENAGFKRNIQHSIVIVATQHWGTEDTKIVNRRLQKYINSGDEIPTFSWIKYEVNINPGYDIYWQVVNTGKHARGNEGLRGPFFKGGNIQWERSLYTGKHWIQCFIMKDGECIAKSKPFFVIFQHPSVPYEKED